MRKFDSGDDALVRMADARFASKNISSRKTLSLVDDARTGYTQACIRVCATSWLIEKRVNWHYSCRAVVTAANWLGRKSARQYIPLERRDAYRKATASILDITDLSPSRSIAFIFKFFLSNSLLRAV